MSPRAMGAVLVLASTVPFALAGIFTRAISADVWTVLAWRGVLGGALIALYVRRYEGHDAMGWRGWALAGVSAAASAAFLSAFRATHVAHVAMIYTTAPFLAAALTWMVFREAPARGVLAAALMSALGVALVVGGGVGTGRLSGDLLALLMTLLMVVAAMMIRAFAGVPVLRAMAAAGVPLALAGVAWGQPFAIAPADAALLCAFAFSFALATVLLTEGARRLPAAEVALLGGLELPLVVALGVIVLGEWPAPTGWAGGALVAVAVLWQARQGMRAPPLSSSER
ncbi:MAG: DMT family transporter [Paracoccaceae bacterium]